MEWIRDVTDEEFQKEVVERSHEVPVVVDFWASWCGPCRILGPILEKLATEAAGGFILAKIDVDRSPQTAQEFGVQGIPTVVAFRKGSPTAKFSGALPEPAVRQFLRKIAPSEAVALSERASERKESDPAAAEALYRQALTLEPTNVGAALGLAEMLLARGVIEEAQKLIENVQPVGPLSERAKRIRSELELLRRRPDASEEELRSRIARSDDPGPILLELGKLLASERRFTEALEALFQAARSNRDLAQGEAKDLMVEIFRAIGVRDPLADEYRTKLSRLLY